MNKPTALPAFFWKQDIPFLKNYLQRNHRTVFLLSDSADQETVKALEATGSQVKVLNVSVNQAVIEEATQAVRLGVTSLQADGAPKKLSCAIEEKVLLETYESVLGQYLPSVIALLNELQQIENEYFIELILLNEETSWLGKTIAGWAKQHGIPSILLSHGAGILKNCNFERYQCDTIAVFGDRNAEYYFDSAVPRERVEVIGNPNWNIFSKLKLEKCAVRQALCEQAGLDTALPIIVFGITRNTRLSAMDDRDLVKELNNFLSVFPYLIEKSFQPQLVVIDQPATGKNNQDLLFDIAHCLGVPSSSIRYELTDEQCWVAGADVVVSIDSNLSVEAMLVETPAINLITSFGMLAGPGFSPEDPILHCESAALAGVIEQVLASEKLRGDLQQKMRSNAKRFNCGVDGRAEERLCNLIKRKRKVNPAGGVVNYAWENFLKALPPLVRRLKQTLLNQTNKLNQTNRLLRWKQKIFRK